MIRVIVMSFMIAFAAVNAVVAETVEIPLPALLGTYGCENTLCVDSRTASFQLDILPDTIYAVSIRLSGTVTVGEYWCSSGGGPPFYADSVGMDFNAHMLDSLNSHWWSAEYITPDEDGAFEYQVQFEQLFGATWEYLESGRGDVSLTGGPPVTIPECGPITYPVATLTEAVLVIEADFPIPISTDDKSWGAIKSLYR